MTDTILEPAESPRFGVDRALEANELLRMINGHWVAQIVRTAAELRLADHVVSGADTAEAVAARESSDPAATYRLMRACVSIGLLRRTGDRGFAVTPTGDLLRSDVPGSLRDSALTFAAPGHWLPWGKLPDAVRQGRSQAESVLGTDVFGYFASHPEESRAFSGAMSAFSEQVVSDVVRLLDTRNATVVTDIGGAHGVLLRGLLSAHPGLNGCVFDLPHVIEDVRPVIAASGFGERFSAVAGDFFDEVPAADGYVLKYILHDWDDESCLRILRNCRAAVRPDGWAAVIENVIDTVGERDRAVLLDVNMLAISSGRERELGEYDTLFAASGWRRAALHPLRGPGSLIELEAV
jgi:hypothetical protein